VKWPEIPTCHRGKTNKVLAWMPARPGGTRDEIEIDEWQGRRRMETRLRPYAEPFRSCSWCGGIAAEDLVALAQAHVLHFEVADMKYGWPHKIYVDGIPNPIAGQEVCSGGESGGLWPDGSPRGVHRLMLGLAPSMTHCKFYCEHLQDQGYDDEAFEAIALLIRARTRVEFQRDSDGRMKWKYLP
jgi:hypothetical protein